MEKDRALSRSHGPSVTGNRFSRVFSRGNEVGGLGACPDREPVCNSATRRRATGYFGKRFTIDGKLFPAPYPRSSPAPMRFQMRVLHIQVTPSPPKDFPNHFTTINLNPPPRWQLTITPKSATATDANPVDPEPTHPGAGTLPEMGIPCLLRRHAPQTSYTSEGLTRTRFITIMCSGLSQIKTPS